MKNDTLKPLLLVASGGLLVVVLASGLGEPWVIDLLAHFQLHYAIAACVLLVCTVLVRSRLALALSLVALAIALSRLQTPGPARDGGPGVGTALRVVVCNVDVENETADRTALAVASLEPDLVVLSEVSESRLEPFLQAFPGWSQVAHPREGVFGLAVLSRYPVAGGIADFAREWAPMLSVRVEMPGQVIEVMALHAPIPMGKSGTRERDRILRESAALLEASEFPVLMLGDFNATPWSREARRILGRGWLSELPGTRWSGTYRTSWGPLALPIDHIWFSPHWAVGRTDRPHSRGSDHRLLFGELYLK